MENELINDGYVKSKTTLWFNYFIITGPSSDPANILSGDQFAIQISVVGLAEGEVATLDLTDSTFAALDSISIMGVAAVVPEPMTMALLGLCGLFLRRRK